MNDQQPPAALEAQPAVMRATVQITRAATGKVEEHELVFAALPPDQQPPKDATSFDTP